MATHPKSSFLFLGTGASTGVPVVGCDCAVCRSSDPRNTRLRPSALLRVAGKTLLIDIGPDFRQQALTHNIQRLDGVLITHTHFDHIAGIDELKVLNFHQNQPIPLLLSEESYGSLQQRYDYLIGEKKPGQPNRAEIDFQLLPLGTADVIFCGLPLTSICYWQGNMQVNGFRVGDLAYLTDIRLYDEEIFSSLQGVQHLIVSALRHETSKGHFSFEEAALFAKRVGAPHCLLTHLSHSVDHETSSALLPPGVALAFDGLTFTFEAPCMNT